MTSTEFTIGLDGSRNSSKVLKPPGGGSSDIFGRGTPQVAPSNGTSNDNAKNNETSTNTQSRLFGISSEPTTTPARSQMKSNIFENTQNVQAARSTTKRYVRRNPITGEEIEYFPEGQKKTESNGTEEPDCNGQNDNQSDEKEEETKTEVPQRKPVVTSIRVRNPPGGKSSGIF